MYHYFYISAETPCREDENLDPTRREQDSRSLSVLTDVDPTEPNRPLSATVVTDVKGLHVSAV